MCTLYKKNVKANNHERTEKNGRNIWRINRGIIRRNIRRAKKTKKRETWVIEKINIKGIEPETFDATKALEEIKTKLRELKTKMMKKKFENEIDNQETLEKQRMKIEAWKIKEYKTTIESIKDATKK